jgi:hypothetical protein
MQHTLPLENVYLMVGQADPQFLLTAMSLLYCLLGVPPANNLPIFLIVVHAQSVVDF